MAIEVVGFDGLWQDEDQQLEAVGFTGILSESDTPAVAARPQGPLSHPLSGALGGPI